MGVKLMEFTAKNKTDERYLYQFKNFINSELEIKDYLNQCNKKEISRLKNSLRLINLGYRLQEISGLRVSEIADLEERDIKINANNELIIHVRHGKGNKERYVKCFRDNWVLEKILKLQPKRNNKRFDRSI